VNATGAAVSRHGWVVVSGGAGFIGSHLCDRLLVDGHRVVIADDLSTGRDTNVAHLAGRDDVRVLTADVCDPSVADTITDIVDGPVTAVLHLASPASPPAYLARPLATLAVGSTGTANLLQLAAAHRARFLLASTSEVYGDPLVHPQPENYWGNVNPVGERSVYDEAKRFAEALTAAHHRIGAVDTRIVRIFNTYGPRMQPDDGRVVTNLVHQARASEPMTIYGDGSQTRSFCYVDDLVSGMVALLDSAVTGPVNIGNPYEFTIAELVEVVREVTGSSSPVEYRPLPSDDPRQRQPDITRARTELGWEPHVALREGLVRMIAALES